MAMLRASRFIRSSGSSERIETYHDRIRDVLAADIAPDALRRIHGRMVRDAASSDGATTARRCSSTIAAPETPRTRRFRPVWPARRRARALAFDRAASFYRHALALSPASSSGQAWREGLATALANAGRPADAAEAYLRAAAGAGDLQRVELQRRGAEQFLIGGHIDRGLELIRTMLANMGMSCAAKPPRRTAAVAVAARTASMARVALRVEGRRRHRCRYAPASRHVLVGDDGTVARRHDQRGRVQRPSPAHRARCRRTVPSVARDGDRVGRAGPPIRAVERSADDSSSSQRSWRRASGDPHAIALSRLADGMMAMALGEWKKALTLVRGGAGDPARPVRRRHVGIEHGAEPRDLGPHVSGRAR